MSLNGVIEVDGDKSISHRAIIIGSIAEGTTVINNFLNSEDCISTIECFKNLGIEIELNNKTAVVHGKGFKGLAEPNKILNVGNSGTTIRLLCGILSPQNFSSILTGDDSIKKRPMDRILIPLKKMGANINCENNTFAPIKIHGKNINSIEYTLPVASAQVKSAILFASLFAKTPTIIHEPISTRNHTELMLNYFGGKIFKKDKQIISTPVEKLEAKKINIAGDISSASFFIVAALICKNSHITIRNVGINPTRTGIITALKQMGGDIEIKNQKLLNCEQVCDIEVKSSELKAINIQGEIIPTMIDEIPIFSIAALFAKGTTMIKNAEELKVKESNRIKALATELKKLSGKVEETTDGLIIEGGYTLSGNKVTSYNDHRIAMSLAIAGLKTTGNMEIDNINCINVSFPNFFNILENLKKLGT